MEHKGALLVGLLGFGFVAFVLIKLASQINTNPDLDHFKASPREPTPVSAAGPVRTRAEERPRAIRQVALMELLVDSAVSQQADRAQTRLRAERPWVKEDIPCELVARAPFAGTLSGSERPPRRDGVDVWAATFHCIDAEHAFELSVLVHLAFENGRWDLEEETQKTLTEGGTLPIRWRAMKADERSLALTPVARPSIGFPSRSVP